MLKKYLLIKVSLLIAVMTLSQKTLAQCNVTNSQSNSINFGANGFRLAQSFRALCDGNLEYVQFVANGTGYVPAGTLKIYKGDVPNTATLIHSQSIPYSNVNNSGDVIRINIDTTLPLIRIHRYIFEFNVNAPIKAHNYNRYPDGIAFYTLPNGTLQTLNTYDYAFEVSIAAPTLSTDDVTDVKKVKIFPNPAEDFIKVSGLKEQINFKIYNTIGKEIQLGKVTNNEQINVSSLTNGIYFLKFNDGNIVKFIKK